MQKVAAIAVVAKSQ